jgi:hypothetical protein
MSAPGLREQYEQGQCESWSARTEGVEMLFWEILGWAAIVLLYVFRIALVVGIVAAIYLIVRGLHGASKPVRHAGVPGRR